MSADFEFTLSVTGLEGTKQEDFENAYYGAGCDDALIGIGGKDRGRVSFDFARGGEDMATAISSAIADILSVEGWDGRTDLPPGTSITIRIQPS